VRSAIWRKSGAVENRPRHDEAQCYLEQLRLASGNEVNTGADTSGGRVIGKLADLRRAELKDRDSRIFPGQYAPVMVME
jgi:hypothetical protein